MANQNPSDKLELVPFQFQFIFLYFSIFHYIRFLENSKLLRIFETI